MPDELHVTPDEVRARILAEKQAEREALLKAARRAARTLERMGYELELLGYYTYSAECFDRASEIDAITIFMRAEKAGGGAMSTDEARWERIDCCECGLEFVRDLAANPPPIFCAKCREDGSAAPRPIISPDRADLLVMRDALDRIEQQCDGVAFHSDKEILAIIETARSQQRSP